jgi:hypothetical protein
VVEVRFGDVCVCQERGGCVYMLDHVHRKLLGKLERLSTFLLLKAMFIKRFQRHFSMSGG